MEPEGARHHVRDDDVTLHLVDEDEERRDPEDADRVDDERVEGGRDGREPGADVRDHLDEGRPDPEEQRVPVGAVHEAGLAEDPHPDAGARADHDREDHLAPDVAPERPLDALGERRPACGREPAVDRALEPRHVEEHVDRDHDHEHDREEQEDHRERGALRERDRVLHVAGDVARADRLGEVVELLLDPDPLEAVVVEPCLEPVDVDLDPRLPRRRSSSVRYASIRSAPERVSETTTVPSATMIPMKTVAKSVDTTATESPRGSRRRVNSRTSGLSVNAITAAVRNRNRTWPSVRAQQKREQQQRPADRRAGSSAGSGSSVALVASRADRIPLRPRPDAG